MKDERLLVLTGQGMYLFLEDALMRRHAIERFAAIVKSTVSREVVFVYPQSKDLRIQGLSPDDVTQL